MEISDTLDLNEYIVRTYGRFTKVDDRQKPFIKKYLNGHEIIYNQINPGKTLRGISVEEKKNLLSPSKDFKIKLYYDKFSTGERFGLEDIFKKEEKESKYSLHSNFLGYIGELATEYMMIGHKYTSSFPCREKYNSNNVIDVNAPGFDGVFSDGDSVFLTESRSRLRSQRVSEMFKEVFYDRWAEIKDKNKLDKMPKIKLGECGIFDNIDKFNMEDTVLSFVKKFKDKPDKLFMLASRFNKYGYGEVYVRSLAELPNDKREKIMKLLGDDSQMLTKIDDQTPNTGGKKENIDNSGLLVFPVSRGVSLEDRIKAMNLTEFSNNSDVDRALKVLMTNGVEIFTNKETNVNGQQFFLDLTALPLKNTFSSFLGFN